MEKEDFVWEMWHLTRDLERTRLGLCMDFCKKYGLTQQQLRILLQIRTLGSTTLTQLSQDLDINPGNLSKTCKALEEAAFITRKRHDDDKRVWTIELDKKGTEVTALIVQHIHDIFGSFSSRHSDEEMNDLLTLLREYVQFYRNLP
ncbi:MAG: MarR family transcriptional regulator [Chloroflexi bacterium]|jgi:DNA-binding MarR family transcriptional regulator|nr:MarR family transcriptional regulator [Chloroflexota bacterium]